MRTPRALLLVAGLIIAAAGPAAAALPPGTGPDTASWYGAAWLQNQVNDQGFIPSAFDPAKPDLSVTAQALVAFGAARIGTEKVGNVVTYLSNHVDDLAMDSGVDSPGGLAYLILGVEAVGLDAHAFGQPPTDLVARLLATKQATGSDAGLFGSQPPTYDGAYRQGLAFLALTAASAPIPEDAVAWLLDQQCSDGLWTAYRADTSVACPAVDPNTFSGPDTNSSALGAIGMQLAGNSVAATAAGQALDAVRNAGGGWGFLARADQATDANSTALVADAFRLVNGAVDEVGLAALGALQNGCGVDASAQGAFAYQPESDGSLFPNALATVQAVPAMAGIALPVVDAQIGSGSICAVAVTSRPDVTTASTEPDTIATTEAVSDSGLVRTGAATDGLVLMAFGLIGSGLVFVAESRRRARSHR